MFKQKRDRYHLLKKFANREITGNFVPNRSLHTRHAKAHELFKDIPDRCTYQLSELILLGRHVFMGMTRCGRFLVTYSYLTSPSLLSPSHEYRLHWWLYHPFKQATKVAEVKLFSDQAINNIVTVGIAQWPNVNNRLIVYGYSAGSDEDNMASSSSSISELEQRRYYFTVTTLPSTNDCKDCKSVASSFNEEDMAANWDSCVGLSCLKHGLTVHTSFDVLFPFPSFHPCINLKLDNTLVFNSGNFLHVIYVEMENNTVQSKSNHAIDSIVPDRINYKVGKLLFFNYSKDYLLPLNVEQACQIHQTILLYQQQQSAERATRRWCNRIPNLAMKPVPTKTKAWRRTITDQAEKVYAFEEVEDGCEPKFKWYRRKRLADKMYEFCSDEEDMENIQPEGKNRLPRYKFSTPSPEKNRTIYDKTDFIVSDEKEHHHQVLLSTKLDMIQQPFTKMMINNKIRLSERHIISSNDKKTDQELSSNLSQDFIDNKVVKNNDAYSFSVTDFFDTSPSSPLSHKNLLTDSDSNNSVSSSSICYPSGSNSATMIFTNKRVSNELKTQLVIKTDEKQDCDIFEENVSKHETILDIIKEWEVDSVSSLSPKCEAWIPNPSDIKRHNIIQKFLEIPQQCDNVKYNNGRSMANNFHRKKLFECSSSTNSKEKKPSLSQNVIKSYEAKLNENLSKRDCQRSESNAENEIDNAERLAKLFPKIKVVLRPCNRNRHNLKDPNKQLVVSDTSLEDDKIISKLPPTSAKEEIKPKIFNKAIKEQLNDAFGHHLIQGCSVQLDRRFIEVDEEMISTITDIEDDDQSSIGFHCALPIVVHGTAYSQLQMVSNSKADKLNCPSVFVRQSSLDIEPLCHQAADIICDCEGYKFWSLNDYETEIINICPFKGGILFLVHMRLNVEPRCDPLIYQFKKQLTDKRDYYECRCIFIWNSEAGECRLEAYTKLTSANSLNSSLCNKSHSTSFTLAQREASKLRNNPNIGLFSYDLNLPVRSLDHQLYDEEYNLRDTVHEIRDQTNFLVITLDSTDLGDNLSRRNVIELM